ncbi:MULTISPECIES: antitoxin VbhA family protein [unclassified Bacillus (in: firmicutes)]|uniref:antitoxin VbhA family protein n=1 Tax=unclassified Bacillus (in: firmicutes) TaxID=185979 RepID=UPI000D0315B0|nr:MULTISPECIES: antitoxin VbhA family protein [unclassified Bacillus (in: firmicutes)]PRS75216.1 hypothetical protein C6346_18485 [Bacillus sp. CJCL2]PRS80721.1 hypothetical protein C6348_18730 [Bacillus sp. YBWC18]
MNITIQRADRWRVWAEPKKGGSVMKMTKSEFEKGMIYAKATHAIEGIYLTADEEELIWKHASGQITDEEFDRKALELANKVIQ